MAIPTLESVTALLFEQSDAILGDTFTLTPMDGPPITLRRHADHGDRMVDFGSSSAIVGDACVEIAKTDRAEILSTDIIHLPVTGANYTPRDVRTDRSGRYWIVELEKVPD